MKAVVLSLGGSLIVPEEMDYKFLKNFKKTIEKNKSCKFAVVCGGGVIARDYISALKKEHKSKEQMSRAGIRATCMNAQFMMQLFGKASNSELPKSMRQVKEQLEKNQIVFCCAFKYIPNQTSDSTASQLARYLKTDFINITNVDGMYNKNPKYKGAKLIREISWKDFEKSALKIKFSPGQHFVLDQKAASLIRKEKIRTYIIGKNMKNLDNIIKGKKFTGTLIHD